MGHDYSDLIGLAELADLLCVSRSRVFALRKDPGFPPPVLKLRATPVWSRDQVTRWSDARPPRDVTSPSLSGPR